MGTKNMKRWFIAGFAVALVVGVVVFTLFVLLVLKVLERL